MKAKCSSLDIISNLPENITESILCLLPIEDAVRTSILSRNWRFNWAKIPKLAFNYNEMFKKSTDDNQLSVLEQSFADAPSERKHLTKRCRFFYAVYQVLLLHQGPLHEFTLLMNANDTCVEIDQIILHLSRINTLKKLTLDMKYTLQYKVPVSVFSLPQLTHLDLQFCDVDHEREFNVCGTLTSLFMENVKTSARTLMNLISKSPLLKSLTVNVSSKHFNNRGGLTFPKLFKCLPVIEHLFLSLRVIECFEEDVIPRKLPTSLVHLKYLHLEDMWFVETDDLSFLALLIRCSPNLENLKLHVYQDSSNVESENESVTLQDYSDIKLEHLTVVEIENFGKLKVELEFVKLVLSKSPVLKKVRIVLSTLVDKDQELEILRSLLRSPRASLLVEISVQRDV